MTCKIVSLFYEILDRVRWQDFYETVLTIFFIASFGNTISSVPSSTDMVLSFPINSLLTPKEKVLVNVALLNSYFRLRKNTSSDFLV